MDVSDFRRVVGVAGLCAQRDGTLLVLVCAEIRCALEKSGTPTGNLDMLIAAIAKQSDYILVTNNTDHFRRVHGLKVENWVK